MKYQAIFAPLLVALMLPALASAHEKHVYEINGVQYQLTVGSIGEPMVVDDKSGVDLRIATLPANKPLEGAQNTLQVELISGGSKKTLPLETVYGTPGAYKAPFFPTTNDPISYRIFGTIASTSFSDTFACSAGGHVMNGPDDATRVEVSPGVVRIDASGSFSCPTSKAAMGFPAQSDEVRHLKQGRSLSVAALALSVIALVLAMRGAASGSLETKYTSRMDKNTLTIAAIALLIGFGGGYLFAGKEPAPGSHILPNGMVMDDSGMTMGHAMDDMMAGLKGKKGDEFDKAFLAEMIVHHQGAVDMAQATLESGKHEELKALSRAIIEAQTKEISQMKAWQQSWYGQQ